MASTAGIRPLVAGNWKMNGVTGTLAEAERVQERLRDAGFAPAVDVMICPPATLIAALARQAAGSAVPGTLDEGAIGEQRANVIR